ncbi:MAG: hypothetical protein JKY29_03680 [Gammaproteobacteria bacterium]|nr:hypothetical protein [Gammaproteobacteria bacterium]
MAVEAVLPVARPAKALIDIGDWLGVCHFLLCGDGRDWFGSLDGNAKTGGEQFPLFEL